MTPPSSAAATASTSADATATPTEHPASRRILGGLMLSSVFGGLGQLIGLTVSGLMIKEMLGSATWIGTGNAAMQLGTAAGAFWLSRLMNKHGRRLGLTIGYFIGLSGGIVVGMADTWQWFPLVLVGLFLFGFANTSNQQARFAAADAVSDARRASAVGMVVWSTTVGVVIGPLLSGPLGRALDPLGVPEYGGAFIVGGLVYVLAAAACWTILRPDPLEISRQLRPPLPTSDVSHLDVKAILRRPAVRLAMGGATVNQVVMVLVMSMTSVHLKDHGHSTSSVGITISLHVLGMYGTAPISGWLCDRIGRLPVMMGGSALLVISGFIAAVASPEGSFVIDAALLILGLGWNANFVATSALLTDAVNGAERTRLQGVNDMVTFIASAGAALAAGFGLRWAGYGPMASAAAIVAGIGLLIVISVHRSHLRTAAATTE